MKTLILLLAIIVFAALGTHFSVGSLRTMCQTVLFVTAGISAVVLMTGMTD